MPAFAAVALEMANSTVAVQSQRNPGSLPQLLYYSKHGNRRAITLSAANDQALPKIPAISPPRLPRLATSSAGDVKWPFQPMPFIHHPPTLSNHPTRTRQSPEDLGKLRPEMRLHIHRGWAHGRRRTEQVPCTIKPAAGTCPAAAGTCTLGCDDWCAVARDHDAVAAKREELKRRKRAVGNAGWKNEKAGDGEPRVVDGSLAGGGTVLCGRMGLLNGMEEGRMEEGPR